MSLQPSLVDIDGFWKMESHFSLRICPLFSLVDGPKSMRIWAAQTGCGGSFKIKKIRGHKIQRRWGGSKRIMGVVWE